RRPTGSPRPARSGRAAAHTPPARDTRRASGGESAPFGRTVAGRRAAQRIKASFELRLPPPWAGPLRTDRLHATADATPAKISATFDSGSRTTIGVPSSPARLTLGCSGISPRNGSPDRAARRRPPPRRTLSSVW